MRIAAQDEIRQNVGLDGAAEISLASVTMAIRLCESNRLLAIWASLCLLSGSLCAQSSQSTLPPPPLLPVPISQGIPPVPAVPAVPPPQGFAGNVLVTITHVRQSCCDHLKTSPLGKMLSNLRKPLSTVTGGIIASEGAPGNSELAKGGAEGAAAQIQQMKIEGPKRTEAVKNLAGIDVRYHPEVAQALIIALRADPNECVRLEAAKSLASTVVCSKPIVEALRICVDGTEVDGNPAELSDAVRRHAARALQKCLSCTKHQAPVLPAPRPEYPEEIAPASLSAKQQHVDDPLSHYRVVDQLTWDAYRELVDGESDKTNPSGVQQATYSENFSPASATNVLERWAEPAVPAEPVTPADRSLLGLWRSTQER